MHDCPGARVGPGGGLHIIRHNFEIAIGKAPLARDRFPAVAFHAPIVVAAVFSGKLCSGFVSNAWALGTSSVQSACKCSISPLTRKNQCSNQSARESGALL